MTFNDDEQLVQVDDNSDNSFGQVGGVQVDVQNNPEAPLEETTAQVLVTVKGVGDNKVRSPVDLVAVLDVSGSMEGDKLKNLQTAMKFLIQKLGSVDRLSIVKFSGNSERLFPLRQITDNSRADIEQKVIALKAGGSTNIADGLTTGLKVLKERRLKDGRVGTIMLMSDGNQTEGDATKIQVPDYAVYTFGFGVDYKPDVLQAIARNSNGGTFSAVPNEKGLSLAFSQCLGGLLTVVVQELNVTISTKTRDTPPEKEAKIVKVNAGSYKITDDDSSSKTIQFGELYNQEVRKIMVDLVHPGVETGRSYDFLIVSYKYRTSRGSPLLMAPPGTATITRTESPVKKDIPEMIVEGKRLETVETVKAARSMADIKQLEEAKDKLDEAENILADVVVPDPNKIIENLITDVQQLFKYMKDQPTYDKYGRPYALAFESSHERQRYSARGDDLEKQRAFATPRMDAYLEQAKQFDKDPTKPPPSEKDDIQKELLEDPFGPLIGPLSLYIQTAIQALKSIDDLFKKAARRPN